MTPKEYRENLDINGLSVEVISEGTRDDFISLTDIARYKSDNEKIVIQNWMRNRNTLEFLGVWEEINNPDFKGIEFDAFRHEAGLNSFVMTPTKWITSTNGERALYLNAMAIRQLDALARSENTSLRRLEDGNGE